MGCKSKLLACSALGAMCLPVLAHADNPAPGAASGAQALSGARGEASPTLGEVIVTAEKRSTSLQRTPIAVTALTGKTLGAEQVRTLSDIVSLAPSFQMGEAEGYQQITIRGIGVSDFQPGSDATVSVNVNEVNVSRPIAQATGFFDVSQLEVLRGPQGTLYGRNASAGSVNISTTLPTDAFSGYGKVTIGNYDDIDVEGAVGGPVLGDKLLVRIAGFSEDRGGYGRNITTGNPVDNKVASGVRGTLIFQPTSDFTGTVIVEHYTEHDNAGLHYFGATGLSGLPGALGLPPQFVLFGGHAASNPWDVATGSDPKFRLTTTAVTGILQWSRGPFTLKSITGYRDQRSSTFTPLDGGSTNNLILITGEPASQISEEFQGHYDTTSFHGTAGLYYFDENDDYSPATGIASGALLNLFLPIKPARNPTEFFQFAEIGGLFKTRSVAAFAQGTYDLGAGVSLTAGIRYSDEHKTLLQRYAIYLNRPYTGFNPAPGIEQPPLNFTSTTPKFGIQYQVDPRTMLYASYSQGFKAGGFDPGSYPASIFKPEHITDYEGGIKSTWLDGRLRTDADAFYYDYTNLQVQQIVGLAIVTDNAATATVYGLEAEFSARPTEALSFDGSFSWLHARYGTYLGADPALPRATTNSNYSGKTLDNAPDFTLTLAGQYKWNVREGVLVLRAEGNYSSRFYFAPDNFAVLSQSAFAKGNVFLTYTNDKGWYASAFVRNIANTFTKTSSAVSLTLDGNAVQGAVAPPRTFGMELGYRF
jgi:iron complex outermembrane receptor protein